MYGEPNERIWLMKSRLGSFPAERAREREIASRDGAVVVNPGAFRLSRRGECNRSCAKVVRIREEGVWLLRPVGRADSLPVWGNVKRSWRGPGEMAPVPWWNKVTLGTKTEDMKKFRKSFARRKRKRPSPSLNALKTTGRI